MHQQALKYTPDELRARLAAIGCEVTKETTLLSFPKSIHWHIKKLDERRGTLEATWLTDGQAWLCYHDDRHQPWIAGALAHLL